METIDNVNMLNHKLAQCTGTTKYLYDGRYPWLKYTEGFKHMMELAGAYWVLDVFATEFYEPWKDYFVEKQYTCTMRMDTKMDSSCYITMFGAGDEPLYNKKIPFTTFPKGGFEFLVSLGYTESRADKTDMLLYLKSER